MKLRHSTKRRITSIRAMRKGCFSRAEHRAFALLLKGFDSARFLKRKPITLLAKPGATIVYRPMPTIADFTEAARLMDAKQVQPRGRMLWDGQKMHGGRA